MRLRPQRQPGGSDKFRYKLKWYQRLHEHLAGLPASEPAVVCGDFNVAPEDRDVYDAARVENQVMFSDPEREAFSGILGLGFADTLRIHDGREGLYSWWDYRQGALARNLGWRIDFILANAALSPRCDGAGIDVWPRRMPQASDHTPIYATFSS